MTGYNKAFVINNETKEVLIREDPKSAELIKPVLKGKDIQKYKNNWENTNRWLIATFPALKIDIDLYPAVKRHLLSFGKERLEQTGMKFPKSRKKTIHAWYELQDTCAYYEEFSKKKLVWIELAETARFCYDESGIYCEATCFIMTGESLKYLCALLNAKLVRWFFPQVAPTSGMGTLRWKKIYVETVPIPKISTDKQKPFIQLVDKILAAKVTDGEVDTSHLEAEIDHLVYKLYGLNAQETTTIDEISYQKQ